MSDYIKREDAINAFYTATGDGDKAEWCVGVIHSIPAADVVEIEPGAWILTDYDGNTMKIKGIQRERIEEENEEERKKGEWREDMWLTTKGYSCSECHAFTTNPSMFCPNCGADMRRES